MPSPPRSSAPPTRPSHALARRVGRVDVRERGRDRTASVSLGELPQRLHVPDVIFVDVNVPCSPAGGTARAEVGERLDGPAVAAVGLDIRRSRCRPALGSGRAAPSELTPRCSARSSAPIALGSAARCRRADRGVLLAQQLLRLRRPRHQLAVEAAPSRFANASQQPGRADRRCGRAPATRLERRVVEEAAARCACSRSRCPRSTTPKRSRAACFVAAHDDDRARAHVLLLADDAARRPACGSRRTPRPDARAVRPLARLGRRHRRRQVDQPLRIAAKRLITSSAAVAFSSRIVTLRCSRVSTTACRARPRCRADRRRAAARQLPAARPSARTASTGSAYVCARADTDTSSFSG